MQGNNHDGKLAEPSPARLRCAIYTRKSTEEGLDQEFNSLDAPHWMLQDTMALRPSDRSETPVTVSGCEAVELLREIHPSKEVNPGGDLADIFNGGHIEGNFYADIYGVASATPVLSLNGHFRNVDPLDLFRSSAWISKRYYVLPLDILQMNRFALCDVQQAAARVK